MGRGGEGEGEEEEEEEVDASLFVPNLVILGSSDNLHFEAVCSTVLTSLIAYVQLYKSLCQSVGPSVRLFLHHAVQIHAQSDLIFINAFTHRYTTDAFVFMALFIRSVCIEAKNYYYVLF